jgi:DHA2 family multidrug resistance protein
MRNLGGAIGIAACATILNNRTNLHFLRLAEHLNSTNAAMLGMLHQLSVKFASAYGGDLVHGHGLAIKQLWLVAYREARVQTFSDAFLVIAVCLGIGAIMVPLLRKVSSPAAPTTDGH